MSIDQSLKDALDLEYVSKKALTVIQGSIIPKAGVGVSLGSTTNVFSDLYVTNLHATSVISVGVSMDLVDGIHATRTPVASTLLALDANAQFPTSVYPQAVLKSGITADLPITSGIKLGGVDLPSLSSSYSAHIQQVNAHHNKQHGFLSTDDHAFSGLTKNTFLRASDPNGVLFDFIYDADIPSSIVRTSRQVYGGDGLSGGGNLSTDVYLAVNPGAGMLITNDSVTLGTPSTLTSSTVNSSLGTTHTHQVNGSSNPSNAQILVSDAYGALRLTQLALGSAASVGVGGLGLRTLNVEENATVAKFFSAGAGVLTVDPANAGLYVNQPNPVNRAAAVIATATAYQRGVVIKGSAGQSSAAPLFSIRDSNENDLFNISPAGDLYAGYVSGISGWKITGSTGDAEFRNITARGELHTAIFVKDEMHVTGGTMMVMTAGKVSLPTNGTDNVMCAVDTQFNMIIQANPDKSCPFATDDVLRLKYKTASRVV